MERVWARGHAYVNPADRAGHGGRVNPQEARRHVGSINPRAGRHIQQDAREHAGRTRARRTHASTPDARKHAGRTRARRTHASTPDARKHAGRTQGASLLWTGIGFVGACVAEKRCGHAQGVRNPRAGRHIPPDARKHAGRTQARRTHARGVPPMDGDWVRDIIFRVPQCQIGLMVGDWDGAGCWHALIYPNQAIPHVEFAGNTRNPPTPGIIYADFTRHTCNPPTPGIVYADFTRHTC